VRSSQARGKDEAVTVRNASVRFLLHPLCKHRTGHCGAEVCCNYVSGVAAAGVFTLPGGKVM